MGPNASLKGLQSRLHSLNLLHHALALGEERVQGGNCSPGLGALLERKTTESQLLGITGGGGNNSYSRKGTKPGPDPEEQLVDAQN